MKTHDLGRGAARAARLLAILASIAVAATGHAQGVPAVPDPITIRDLVEYAEIVDLSEAQRIAMGPALDEYYRRFAVLRDTEITEFLDGLISMAEEFLPGGMRIPERTKLEAVVAAYKQLLPRIEAIDRELFTQIQAMCSDEQILRAERCKTLRALAIHDVIVEGPFEELNEGASPRLSALMRDVEITPEARASIDAMLSTYEKSMLGEVRRLHEVVEDVITRALDIVDEIGLREMDTAAMMTYFQDESNQNAMMDRFNEESKPLQAQLHAMAKLNERTFRRVLALLGSDDQELLRAAYFERAYGRAYDGPGAWRSGYAQAVETDWLDEERRTLIRSERSRFVTADDALCDQIAAILERERTYRTMDELENESESDAGRRWRALRDDRNALQARAVSTLHSILGPEDLERFGGPTGQQTEPTELGAMVTTVVAPDGTVVSAVTNEAPVTAAVEGLARALDAADRDLLIAALAMDESDAFIVETLFEDYRGSYAAALEEIAAAMATLAEIEDPAKRDRETRTALHAARERVAGIDGAFFESVAAFASGDAAAGHVQRLEDARLRARTRVSGRGFWSNQAGEASVDLVRLLYKEAGLAGTLDPSIASALDVYGQEANRVVAERLAASDEMQRRMAMMERLRGRESGDAAAQAQAAESMRERWQESITAVRRSDRALAAANRSGLERVLGNLPSDRRWPVEYAYRLAAYPEIYRPAESIEKSFASALALPDLMPSQRERVAESLSAYRQQFKTLSDEMIENRQARDQMDFDFMPDREMIERELTLERLRFGRRELGERTKWELNLLLNTGQRAALSGG